MSQDFDPLYNDGWAILNEFDEMYLNKSDNYSPDKELKKKDTTKSGEISFDGKNGIPLEKSEKCFPENSIKSELEFSKFEEVDHLQQFWSLTLVITFLQFYTSLKNIAVIGNGISAVENFILFTISPVTCVVKIIAGNFPKKVNFLRAKVVDCVTFIDSNCFSVVKAIRRRIETVKICINHKIDSVLDYIINLPIGYLLLQLVDLLITIMTSIVGAIDSKDREVHDILHENQEIVHKPNASIDKIAGKTGFIGTITWIITAPFRLLLASLWFIRNKFMPFRRDKSDFFSPSKSFTRRRRLSPIKRVKTRSFFTRFISHTLAFLGVRPMARFPKHKIKFISAQKMAMDDKGLIPEKRRFSDVSEESISDDDANYLDEGMEDYISEEDPDYEPTGNLSDDSYEYKEGDTESFIELEDELLESPGKRESATSKRATMNRKELKVSIERVDAVKEHEAKPSKKEKQKSSKANKSANKSANQSASQSDTVENKENQEPEQPKAISPSKILRPQNMSNSPVLKPEWVKHKPGIEGVQAHGNTQGNET